MIKEYFPGATDFVPEDCPVPTLYVLTNDAAHNGAACVLYPDKLKDLADEFGSDLLILPSSIHEVLIIADSEILRNMIIMSSAIRSKMSTANRFSRKTFSLITCTCIAGKRITCRSLRKFLVILPQTRLHVFKCRQTLLHTFYRRQPAIQFRLA